MPSQHKLTWRALPPSVEAILRAANPWWRGSPGPTIPDFRRSLFGRARHLLENGMTPAVVLRGTRRVGKTVMVRQIVQALLDEGTDPKRVLYVPFDDLESLRGLPEEILSICFWFQDSVLGVPFNEASRRANRAYIFLDEVQNLSNWSPQVKHLVDNHDLRVMLTGSSSLRIAAGQDSLAGRVTTLHLGPLSLREIARLRHGDNLSDAPEIGIEGLRDQRFWRTVQARGLEQAVARDRAFRAYCLRGGYPQAQERDDVAWPDIAQFLNETVVQRTIQHDLRLGSRGQRRDPQLLEEVFRLACRYAGQAPGSGVFIAEVQQTMAANIGWQRISQYLDFLAGALLIHRVEPLEIKLKRRKGAAKLCLSDLSLRQAWLGETVSLYPDDLAQTPHLADLAGHLAESAAGQFFSTINELQVTHFPARPTEPEVDFVLTAGAYRIPVEVKYRRRIQPHEDTVGLRAFLEHTAYNAPFGLLVTQGDDVHVDDARIVPISLASLLWLR